ncbi:fetC [Scenedesmus sp. PABB004]|nr:fetC [Scenedesmus sp. PABB004]
MRTPQRRACALPCIALALALALASGCGATARHLASSGGVPAALDALLPAARGGAAAARYSLVNYAHLAGADAGAAAGLRGAAGLGFGSGACAELPTAPEGGACGEGVAVCAMGLCCGQAGVCSKSAVACAGSCQCRFSGVLSNCAGSFPFAVPRASALPVAKPGGPCGVYVATCPHRQCCSQFGFCVADASIYCHAPTCRAGLSPASAACTGAAPGGGRVLRFAWTLRWKRLALDGFERPVIVWNDELFPQIDALVGDRVVLALTNAIGMPTSLHFHGLPQRGYNLMDGADVATQRLIRDGETFTYNFVVDVAGTFWMHSHTMTQYVDGLSGYLIVRAPADAGRYNADAVVALRDWYPDTAESLVAAYMGTGKQARGAPGGREPTPHSGLINEHGQGHCAPQPRAVAAGAAPAPRGAAPDAPPCGYSYVRAVASTCDHPRTRLRIINAGGSAVFNVSIDNHRRARGRGLLIVVSQDGVGVEPVEVGSLTLNNGQRYDVLPCQRLAAGEVLSDAPVWIRATMMDEEFLTPSATNLTLAVLHFGEAPPRQLPDSKANLTFPGARPGFRGGCGGRRGARRGAERTPSRPVALEAGLSPEYYERHLGDVLIGPYQMSVAGGAVPPNSTRTLTYAIDMYNEPSGVHYGHLNNVSLAMAPSDGPSLLERYSSNPEGLGPPLGAPFGVGWQIVDVALGEVVDVVINNHDNGEHPMHTHGMWFFIMAVGFQGDGDFRPRATPLVASVARDTVTVAGNSHIVLRFVADNPGIHLMHCQ